jgi:hypothetical protein
VAALKSALLLIGTACSAVLAAGCQKAAPAAALTPIETLQELIRLHDAGQYATMAPLIVSERASQVVDTLRAVDDVAIANRSLVQFVREHFSPNLADAIDQQYLTVNMEIFSQSADLLDVVIDADGKHATVAFAPLGRLPIERAHLQLVDGRWRYDPGEGYDPRAVRAFQQIADGLRQALADLRAGRPSADQVQRDPNSLVEAVRLRLAPAVRDLPRPESAP